MKKLAVLFLWMLFAWASALCQSTVRNTQTFDSGDVVVSTTGRMSDGYLTKAAEPYAENIVGVYNENTQAMNTPAVLVNGIAYVKFDAQNGHVIKGDYITTSANPGYGMKALHTGFVVGIALEDSHNSSNGLVKIRVQVAWMKL